MHSLFFFPTLTFWLTSELSGAPCWQDQGSTVPDEEHTLPPSLTKSGTEKSLQYLLQDVAGSFTKQDQQGLNPTAVTDSCTDFMWHFCISISCAVSQAQVIGWSSKQVDLIRAVAGTSVRVAMRPTANDPNKTWLPGSMMLKLTWRFAHQAGVLKVHRWMYFGGRRTWIPCEAAVAGQNWYGAAFLTWIWQT